MLILKTFSYSFVKYPRVQRTVSYKNTSNCSTMMRLVSSNALQKPPYFITTPIFYVNADPHIGHVYTAVIADASARFHRLLGFNPVLFSTGTDEHGLKIQQAAAKANQAPLNFCNQISGSFHQAIDDCEISYTQFIRTTDSHHKSVVADFWRSLMEKGYIYQGKYEGWYCIADEMFLAEDQTKVIKLPSGQEQRISIESNRPVEQFSEENYMFKLSKCRDGLSNWLASGPVVQPSKYYNLLKSWLDQDLPDLSISRPSSRLNWGIPVPGDQSQTIYVWLDALLNYLTCAKHHASTTADEFVWPPVHVIGKDILKFHGIYWPAFLLAAGLKPPHTLQVHGHWLVDDEKMSKTLGNVVSPQTCIDRVTATGLRYFLLHEGVPASDGNFSFVRMVRIVNAELADSIGNLVNRCCGKSLNPTKVRPALTSSSFDECGELGRELLDMMERTPDAVHDHYATMQFYKGIDQIMTLIRASNNLFQSLEPWKLKKEGKVEKFTATLAISLETVRIVGILLQPIVPSFSQRLLDKIGVPSDERSWHYGCVRYSNTDSPLGNEETVLFPKVKTDESGQAKRVNKNG